MPIYGLTRRENQVLGRPLMIGKLWLGGQMTQTEDGKTKPGLNLKDKFRFQGNSEYYEQLFIKHFGGLIVGELIIYLVYGQTDKAWECFYEQQGSGKGLIKQCDGRSIRRQQVQIESKDSKGKTTYTWRMKTFAEGENPCPYAYDEQNPQGDCPDCTPTGRLYFHISQFYEDGERGMVVLENHSKINIASLHGHLIQQESQLRNVGGDLSLSPLSSPETSGFVPWRLRRTIGTGYAPVTKRGSKGYAQTGERGRITVYPIALDIDPAWWRLMKERFQMQTPQLAAAPDRPALPAVEKPIAAEPAAVAVEIVASDEHEPEFLPKNESDRRNLERLMRAANQLGIKQEFVGRLFKQCFPEKHSSQLRGFHVGLIVDEMLKLWGMSKTYPSGEPIMVDMEEATKLYESSIDLKWSDEQKINTWKTLLENTIGGKNDTPA